MLILTAPSLSTLNTHEHTNDDSIDRLNMLRERSTPLMPNNGEVNEHDSSELHFITNTVSLLLLSMDASVSLVSSVLDDDEMVRECLARLIVGASLS